MFPLIPPDFVNSRPVDIELGGIDVIFVALMVKLAQRRT